MNKKDELEKIVRGRLDEIKSVPPRNPQMASLGRAQFLSQAVSASESQRHSGWISKIRKEHYKMNAILATLMIVGLLFGGGATVNAAQDDLPNQPLYSLKLWSEDMSLQLQSDPEAKVDRLMDLAQIRLQEMTHLYEVGETVPDQVRDRLQLHIQQALQTCTSMDDPTLERTLLQIRDRLQQQDRDMEQLQLHTQDQQQLLTQTRTMLHERLQLVDEGLLNHEMFRNQVQHGFRFGQDDETTPPTQNGNGQPSVEPNGPNLEPGVPNSDPNGPNLTPGGPNTEPGGPNTDPNGSGSGTNTGGNGSGGNGNK